MTAATFTLTGLVDGSTAPSHSAVSVSGEVDVTNAAEFISALTDRDVPRPVVLDLSKLRYLDSAGFAALDELLARRAVVIVIAPESHLRKAATLMGVPFHDSVDIAQSTLE